jgi:pyridoxamine 5'-phosphate oxidase
MVLATATPDGAPSARVVLCKQLVVEPGYVVFYTNYESRKGRELATNPGSPGSCTGTRSSARSASRGSSRVRRRESDLYFASRALDSRIGARASLQSQPLDSRATLLRRVAAETARHGTSPLARRIGVVIALARGVELWCAGAFRIHDRARWTRTLSPSTRVSPRGPGATRSFLNTLAPMAERTFFGTLRIALLLAILAFVAVGAWLDRTRTRSWEHTLRITVYPLPSARRGTSRYVER